MGGNSSFTFFCYKNLLIILNVFYLIVSLILIVAPAVAIGDAKFTNVPIVGGVIASGVFLLVIAIVGLVGAVKHHQVLLFFYIIALGIVFIILFSVSVAALAVNSSQRHALLEHTWRGLNDHDKAEVQSFFDCCGFDNASVNIKSSENKIGHPSCKVKLGKVSPPKCCPSSYSSVELFEAQNNDSMPTTNATNVTTESSNTTSTASNDATPTSTVTGSTNISTVNPTDYDGHCGDCKPCYNAWSDQVAKAFKVGGGVGLFFSLTELFGLILTIYYRNKKDPTANPNAFL